MLKHVDLCSGIGGFALGFQWAGLSKPVLFCDIDPFCREVLKKHWPSVTQAEDIKELANDPKRLVPDCDVLTAGYPCQPFSVSGKRRGTSDERHIWPYIRTVLSEKRPAACVFENVRGHVKLGLDEVISDLINIGYSVQPFIVPASFVGAPHRRDRVWIVAYSDSPLTQGSRVSSGVQQEQSDPNFSSNICGRERWDNWETEPEVDRVAYGLSSWVDTNRRNKALGNAIVPQIAMHIGLAMKESFKIGDNWSETH